MSFWNFLGALAWWEWLSGADRQEKAVPPHECTNDYGCTSYSGRAEKRSREEDYLDKARSLERRIAELECRQEQCDIGSDRYDELQDRIDDLQDELDELDDNFDAL